MSRISNRAFRAQRIMARRCFALPGQMSRITKRTPRSRSNRSDAMYLLNEAMARARCAERSLRRVSRPAREVAMQAAERRRRGE